MLQIVETNVTSRLAVIDLSSKLLQEGIIEINDVFNAETVSDWRNALLYVMSKISVEESQSNPIQLHINSPGGEVYSCLGLYDTIQMMKDKGYVISTVNVGLAASCASLILMAGTKGYRKSLKNCRTMIHTVSSMTYGKIHEMEVDVDETREIQKIIDNIVKENADERLIKKSEYVDFWMSSDQAKEFGIIDSII